MARRPTSRDDDEGETPPWMERAPKPARGNAEAEPTHTLISWRALIIGAVVALVAAIGLVIGVRRMSTPDAATVAAANGEVPLIRAPSTPYKTRVAPDSAATPSTDPATSRDPIGELAAAPDADLPAPARASPAPTDLLPRGAVDATADAPTPAELASPATAPVKVAPSPAPLSDEPAPKPKPKPKPKQVAKPSETAEPFALPAIEAAQAEPRARSALQLGAFSSEAKAEAAWATATAAHGDLASLHRRIEPIERDGRTLYRLRATDTGPLTPERCAAFKAMGATCVK